MHPENPHKNGYNISALLKVNPALTPYVFINEHGVQTIDFSNKYAVIQLNTGLLLQHYNLKSYRIPEGYLCPPIPGRLDYLLHVKDILVTEKGILPTQIKGLDIGSGANGIYPILGASFYKWQMVGADIDPLAVSHSQEIIKETKALQPYIEIRLQKENAHIFKGIVKEGEYFDFSMCNPPFYSSQQEADKATLKKTKNLHSTASVARNFGGTSNELWCNGGEALFIKRMIKQSVTIKNQVGIFTTLVSRKHNLPKLQKQLHKIGATHTTIVMAQGNKVSHILVWQF